MIYSDKRLSQKLERTEARSNAEFVKTRAEIEPESGAGWIEIAGAYAMFDGAESPLTQTFGLGLFAEAAHDDLGKLETFFRERGAPVFHEISPLADAALLNLLNERGYQPIEMSSVMYLPLTGKVTPATTINSDIKTRRIEAGEETLWAQTAARGWGAEMEGLAEFMFGIGRVSARCDGSAPFLAELGGEPIAAGGLFIYDGTALLAGASTVPEGRRQGAQNALLAARLAHAAEQGCALAMMAAAPGSQSQRNAEKNGFRVAYTRTKWHLKS